QNKKTPSNSSRRHASPTDPPMKENTCPPSITRTTDIKYPFPLTWSRTCSYSPPLDFECHWIFFNQIAHIHKPKQPNQPLVTLKNRKQLSLPIFTLYIQKAI